MIKKILSLIAAVTLVTSCITIYNPPHKYNRYMEYNISYMGWHRLMYGGMINWYYSRPHYNRFYMRILPQNVRTKVYRNQLEKKAVQQTTVNKETFEKQNKEKVKK